MSQTCSYSHTAVQLAARYVVMSICELMQTINICKLSVSALEASGWNRVYDWYWIEATTVPESWGGEELGITTLLFKMYSLLWTLFKIYSVFSKKKCPETTNPVPKQFTSL